MHTIRKTLQHTTNTLYLAMDELSPCNVLLLRLTILATQTTLTTVLSLSPLLTTLCECTNINTNNTQFNFGIVTDLNSMPNESSEHNCSIQMLVNSKYVCVCVRVCGVFQRIIFFLTSMFYAFFWFFYPAHPNSFLVCCC